MGVGQGGGESVPWVVGVGGVSSFEPTNACLPPFGAHVQDTRSTPLHKASRNGHLEVVRALLDHGANVNVFSVRSGAVPVCFSQTSVGNTLGCFLLLGAAGRCGQRHHPALVGVPRGPCGGGGPAVGTRGEPQRVHGKLGGEGGA